MPLSFCSSVKLLISPSNVNKSLAGCSWLQTFPFRHLNISRHSLLARGVSAEKSADNLMGIPVCVIRCFSPDALIFRLCLPFLCLITLCLDTFPRGFLRGRLCTSSTWVTVFPPVLGKFFATVSSNIFSDPFCLSLLLLGPL